MRLSYPSLLFFGTLHSDDFIFPFLLWLQLLFFSQLFYKASSDNHFAFCISFSWGLFENGLLYNFYEPLFIVFHALCLWDPISCICHLHSIILRDLIRSYLYFLMVLPTSFNLSVFYNKQFMIWATVSSQSCFCLQYRASASLAENNIINLILVFTIWLCPCVESSLMLLEMGVSYDQCVLLAKLLLAFAQVHFIF